MKYVNIYDTEQDFWESGPALGNQVSGLAACVVLMSRNTLAHAKSNNQRPKAAWEELDWDDLDYSTEDD